MMLAMKQEKKYLQPATGVVTSIDRQLPPQIYDFNDYDSLVIFVTYPYLWCESIYHLPMIWGQSEEKA